MLPFKAKNRASRAVNPRLYFGSHVNLPQLENVYRRKIMISGEL